MKTSRHISVWIVPAVCFAGGLAAVLALSSRRASDAARSAETPPLPSVEMAEHVTRAEELLAAGRIIEAHFEAEQAERLAPRDARVQLLLGNIAHSSLRKEAAERYYRRAAERDPTLAAAHGNLSLVLLELGHGDEAARAADRALAIRPGDPFYEGLRGRSLLMQGKAKESVPHLEAAVQGGFQPAEMFLGRARDLLGDSAQALVAFDDAIYRDPTDTKAHYWRADCLRRLGRHEEARQALETYRKHTALHMKTARVQEALLVRSPEDAALWIELAKLRLEQGKVGPASSAVDKAAELAPRRPEVRELRERLRKAQPSPEIPQFLRR
jgi:tetratricopeptide (TPR) repeat protein